MRYLKYSPLEDEHKFIYENHPLFVALFNDDPDAIFILDAKDYSILECNNKALEIFEVESKSIMISLPSAQLYESEPITFSRDLQEINLKNGGEYTQELAFRTLKQNIFWGRLKKRIVQIEEHEFIVLRISKVIDYLRAEETLSALLKGTAQVTGKKFFKELTKLLCRSFEVKYAIIGKLASDRKSMKILEYCGALNEKDITKYTVHGTMIDNVVRGYATFYPKGVKDLFPEDDFAKRNNIEGFMGAPVFGNSGEVMGILAFMHNKPIQEVPNSRYILSIFASRTAAEIQRIRSKEILKEQTRSLADANTVKDELLSVFSHNLVNPLQSVLDFTELLRTKVDTYDKEKIIENIEIIDNSIRNIYFLFENLADWSRIYREIAHPHPEYISMKEIINYNFSFFNYIIDVKQLNVEINLDNVPRIHTDKHMINTIISNLVSNAVKYTPKGCSIRVNYKENKDNIIISIKDSGIGMSAEEISMILNADSNIPELNMANKNTGGFGLLLSRNFVKRLGGELWIESKPNEGTEVFVSIPKK